MFKALLLVLLLSATQVWGQTTPVAQRLNLVSVSASENTGQDYSSWLTDDLGKLVPNAWSGNDKWVQVTLKLEKKSLLTSLSLYDYEGTFADKPALLYALNGSQRVLIGSFDGASYKAWVTLTPFEPLVADAILVYKYGNNIPQKIKAFGQPITATTALPRPTDLLKLASVKESPATGQNYAPFLNDNPDNLVAYFWQSTNYQWTDVTLKFDKKSLLSKLELYDFEGTCEQTPALIYALNAGQKTLIATFTGDTYKYFKPVDLAEPVVAEGLIIHKYCNCLPVKIRAYGKNLPTDPLDAILYAQERVAVTSVTASLSTTQNYTPYLNDDMTSLVQYDWSSSNCRWMDLTLKLAARSTLTKLELYDGENVFTATPAAIYALNGTQKTLLGTFTGPAYMSWQEVTFPAVVADAIVITKYCNALPVKIQVYGHPLDNAVSPAPVSTPAPVVAPVAATPAAATVSAPLTPAVAVALGGKIPIDAKRWYQLNNVSNGLDGLFDGRTDVDVQTGWGKLLTTYDAYYPLQEGEAMGIQAIKFFDGNGSSPDQPMILSIIDKNWKRTPIATFTGSQYQTWVGPDPNRQTGGDARFLLDSTVRSARYLVIQASTLYPTEMELYGTYQAPVLVPTPAPRKSVQLRNVLGINAFEWDFYTTDLTAINETKMKALKSFPVIRHYMDWEKLELTEGSFTFNPTYSGGWNYDLMYQRCQAEGIEVLACLKQLPPWMVSTYPPDQQDGENVPLRYGRDFTDPASYIEQARVAFQYVARYGSNKNVNPALLKVNTKPRWTADPINEVKIGLGLIHYIECDNERDKWWKGRKAYQTGREYAANLSAFYDGHKNTMGPGVGVKNADPAMQVVIGGLAAPATATDYIRGMIDWCKQYRGYKPDGKVDLCWDVMNYHLYPDNAGSAQTGTATRGTAPELSAASKIAQNVLALAHDACYDMPVYVSETGYDLNQGSPLKAIAIGSKTELQTQADWNLRTALLYGRTGIDRVYFYQTYDYGLTSPVQFASMGFINPDYSRKPTADYFYQTQTLLGNYAYKETLSTDPAVDRYELNGQSAYALWIPDEKGRMATYTLDLGAATQARVARPKAGSPTMDTQVLPVGNGKLTLTVTETPLFVLPATGSGRLAADRTEGTDGLASLRLYPNPSADYVQLDLTNAYVGALDITIVDAGLGVTRQQTTLQKSGTAFSGKIDLSALPLGLYLLEVKQGSEQAVRRVLRVY